MIYFKANKKREKKYSVAYKRYVFLAISRKSAYCAQVYWRKTVIFKFFKSSEIKTL